MAKKERGILFRAPMVKVLLAGTKTQTRRICKGFTKPGVVAKMCPYGEPGDRLWVRETFAMRSDVNPFIDLAKAQSVA